MFTNFNIIQMTTFTQSMLEIVLTKSLLVNMIDHCVPYQEI